MTEPTQLDKARYSLYTSILFYVLALPLVLTENKSRLLIHSVLFWLVVWGLMNVNGI
jgi:hypothetical protein